MDDEDELARLRERNAALETALREGAAESAARVAAAELRLEAVRAGMVDLDGLKLIDPASAAPDMDGTHPDAAQLVAALRRDKPYLFWGGGAGSSSARVPAPPASAARAKLATEMTLEEWRAARAELLRRR